MPAVLVCRRADTAGRLGQAVTASACSGLSAARIGSALGVPRRTVAGWLAGARVFAARHTARFIRYLTGLGAPLEALPLLPCADPVRELLTVLAALASAAAREWGTLGAGYWERVNLMSGGRLLSGSLQGPGYPEPATLPVA